MTLQRLYKVAAAVLICAQGTVDAFVQPGKALGFPSSAKRSPWTSSASAADFDFALPPGLEVQDSYEQGEVPLFAVVNATLRTSQLVYQFSSMKIDIRENPDEWIDGEDMLKDGMLLEEEIGDFVSKNEARVLSNSEFKEMIMVKEGMKGDNRLRCMDAKFAEEELVYGIGVNRYVSRSHIPNCTCTL